MAYLPDVDRMRNVARGLDRLSDQIERIAKSGGPLFIPHAARRTNSWIRNGCLGISLTVFLAWQYALRDDNNQLADPELWRTLDVRLPRQSYQRVRHFLEDNFVLKWGDQRVSPWTLFTSAFSHMTVGHITSNSIAFQMFSIVVGQTFAPLHFVSLILTTALGGSLAFLLQQSRRKFPDRRIRALGMSGITTGMGVATALIVPNMRTRVLGMFTIPLWASVLGFTVLDTILLDSEKSNVGHAAHLGGALAGLLYASTLKNFGTIYSTFW